MPDKPDHLGHRHRLRDRFLTGGGGALADYELLELLLIQVQPRRDTKPTAKALLKRFGSFAGVLSASARDLAAFQGMGDASAVALKCVQEAALRMSRQEVMNSEVIGSWTKLIDYCRAKMAQSRVEEFHCLFLDSKNMLIADEAQATGTVNHVAVYPREIVKRALELGASAIIMVHNHPTQPIWITLNHASTH